MIEGKTVLLTGGAGFIGTVLARRLLAANDVVVYDNGHRGALDGGIAPHPRLRVVQGDVLDVAAVREAVRGCQLIVHLAAITGVETVLKMPVTTMKVNLIGTFNLLEAAVAAGTVERFVDFSSSEVFGAYAYKVSEGDVTALGAVGEARWTYAVSKLATEHMTHNYQVQYGLPAVSVRPFNVYGPADDGEGVINRFIVRALKGEDVEIHNEGSQIRAWCYVDDIADGVLLCLENPAAVGQAFNIGNPRSVCTIYDLARNVVRLAGSTSRLTFVPWRHADVELRIPNIEKARRVLGYEPRVDLEDGLQRTIQWYRERLSP